MSENIAFGAPSHHLVQVNNASLLSDLYATHRFVQALATGGQNIDDKVYKQIKTAWARIDHNTILIESNVPLLKTDSIKNEMVASIAVSYPEASLFSVKFTPFSSRKKEGAFLERGRKFAIQNRSEALDWISRRLPQNSELHDIYFIGDVSHSKFNGVVWNAVVSMSHKLDSYIISGGKSAFGFGLLIPPVESLSFTNNFEQ